VGYGAYLIIHWPGLEHWGANAPTIALVLWLLVRKSGRSAYLSVNKPWGVQNQWYALLTWLFGAALAVWFAFALTWPFGAVSGVVIAAQRRMLLFVALRAGVAGHWELSIYGVSLKVNRLVSRSIRRMEKNTLVGWPLILIH
jgi:hypothetical protein